MQDRSYLKASLQPIAWFLVFNQLLVQPLWADTNLLQEVSTLATPPTSQANPPTKAFEYAREGCLERSHILNVIVESYKLLVEQELPLSAALESLRRGVRFTPELREHLTRIQPTTICVNRTKKILYCTYNGSFEVRIYRTDFYPDGLPLGQGQEILERGDTEHYTVDVVTSPLQEHPGAVRLTDNDRWQDEWIRIVATPALNEYNRRTAHSHAALAGKQHYSNIFYQGVLPELRAEAERLQMQGEPVFLTMGITGSAASAKSTVAKLFQSELAQEFDHTRMIYFDDWLLQACDRPIDQHTGKTTERLFEKFDVYGFVRAIKAFLKGQCLLKPIYNQTAKGDLKMELAPDGSVSFLLGVTRRVRIVNDHGNVVLRVEDSQGAVLEQGTSITLFKGHEEIPIAIESNPRDAVNDEIIVRVFDTRLSLGAFSRNKLRQQQQRTVQIIDAQGQPVPDTTDDYGETISESGAILVPGGYTMRSGRLINAPWKVYEYIPHEEGVYLIEGLLALYDYPGELPGESLPELYTTSLFVDVDFEIRLDRGLLREKTRYEKRMHGERMSGSDVASYVKKFTVRKEEAEDPYVYRTLRFAKFVATTENRSEAIFSLYRQGRLLAPELAPLFTEMEIDPVALREELDRIEQDFVYSRLRCSTVNGELSFSRKIEGPHYTVYFLTDGMVLKVPHDHRDFSDMSGWQALRSCGGEIMVPGMVVDISSSHIKIDGKDAKRVMVVQNEVQPLDLLLTAAHADTERDPYLLIDAFFATQQRMWEIGVVDTVPSFDRYGMMVSSQGSPQVLLFALNDVSEDQNDFSLRTMRLLGRHLPNSLRPYFSEKVDAFHHFTQNTAFGGDRERARMLPGLFHAEISSTQLGYISTLVTDNALVGLWRLFKKVPVSSGIPLEATWTRLCIDCLSRYSPRVQDALELFYAELLENPGRIRRMSFCEARDLIIAKSPLSTPREIFQVNRFLQYFFRLRLSMIRTRLESDFSSTLRIKPEILENLDVRDKDDLFAILSSPEDLDALIERSEGRIAIAAEEVDDLSEGETIYLTLRKTILLHGDIVEVLRIKGVRPRLEPGTRHVRPYSGNGAARRNIRSSLSGAIIAQNASPKAFGTLLHQDALNEYELMERLEGTTCKHDRAVGIGRYRNISFNNKPVGYVICGMRRADARLHFEQVSADAAGTLVARDKVTGDITPIDPKRMEGFFERAGFSIRTAHDQGFWHRYPHLGNWGIDDIAATDLEPVLRDLNTAHDMYGKPTEQRVTCRFLDVSRVVYDLLLMRSYYDPDDEILNILSGNFPEFVVHFLRGYFYELDPQGAEFQALAAIDDHFVDRIASIAGVGSQQVIDYEEMNSDHPYFGHFIKSLTAIEERLAAQRRAGTDHAARARDLAAERANAALEELLGKVADLPELERSLTGDRYERIAALKRYVIKTNRDGYYHTRDQAPLAVQLSGDLGRLLGLPEDELPLYYTITAQGAVNTGNVNVLRESTDLARDMSFKNPVSEVFFEGGKTYLFVDGDNYLAVTTVYGDKELYDKGYLVAKGGVRVSDARGEDPARRDRQYIFNAVTGYVRAFIDLGTLGVSRIEGPDMRPRYMAVEEIMELIDRLGQEASRDLGRELLPLTTSGRPSEGYFSHDEWRATSLSVLETVCALLEDDATMQRFNVDRSQPIDISIPGFGEVGTNIVRLLWEHRDKFAKYNFRIVGISDKDFGAFYNPKGFDLADVYRLAQDRGNAREDQQEFIFDIAQYPFLTGHALAHLDDLLYAPTTILMPAAQPYVIQNIQDADRLQCRIFAPAANAPLGTKNSRAAEVQELEEYLLNQRGIIVAPAWLLNYGGIDMSKEEVLHRLLEGGLEGLRDPEKRQWFKDHILGGDIMDIAWVNAYWTLHLWKKEGYGRPLSEIMKERARRIMVERKKILLRQPCPDGNIAKLMYLDTATTKAKSRVLIDDLGDEVGNLLAQASNKNAPIHVRRVAAYLMGRISDPQHITVLTNILEDNGETGVMYRNAGSSLGYLLEEEVQEGHLHQVQPIIERLQAIAERLDRRSLAHLSDDNYQRRIWIGWILGKVMFDAASADRAPDRELMRAVNETAQETKAMTAMTAPGNPAGVDLSTIAVVVRRDLPAELLGTKMSYFAPEYDQMRRRMRALFGNGGFAEVSTPDELTSVVNAFIRAHKKVVILDNDTLTTTLSAGSIAGIANTDYCVVSTGVLPVLDEMSVPFVNLYAMAMMGVGIVSNSAELFGHAYKAFNGNEAPAGLFNDLRRAVTQVIRVLPRIIRISADLTNRDQLRRFKKIFDVAA